MNILFLSLSPQLLGDGMHSFVRCNWLFVLSAQTNRFEQAPTLRNKKAVNRPPDFSFRRRFRGEAASEEVLLLLRLNCQLFLNLKKVSTCLKRVVHALKFRGPVLLKISPNKWGRLIFSNKMSRSYAKRMGTNWSKLPDNDKTTFVRKWTGSD